MQKNIHWLKTSYPRRATSTPMIRYILLATASFVATWQLAPLIVSAQPVPQTPAGTQILNRATGTYEDPNNPGNQINTTSNEVTVTVAEIAGITVTASGITDSNGGSVAVNDLLIYTYTVTNVGNAPTKFQIPNLATTTGPATVNGVLPTDKNGNIPPNGTLQYSTDGGVTWTNIPPGGITTDAIPVNGTVQVRVPITVQTIALPGDVIAVRLGQTPGNAQNQPRIADGGDVYTVDNGNTSGPPTNGVREASATQQTAVGNTAATKALATILKTRTAYNAGNLSVLNDDVITYGLSLRVENTDLTGSVPAITPAALAGIPITVNGTPNTTRILISDAIPLNTVLNAAPTPPPGWVVVYSTDDPITVTANAAAWTTTAPALGSVRRVGFINDPNVFTSVAPGATVTGFNIQVITSPIPLPATTPTTIYNIAQVAGTTSGNNDPATNKVYDNSGDQNPDNFAGGTFPTTQDSGYTATPATNLDNQNNNTGTNSAIGNFNPFTISVPNALSILNGPNGTPAAVGPTDNNNDFTNKSALIGPNIPPGTPIDPAPVSFTNTVVNNGTTAGNIALIPTPPAILTDLPTNTVVTISYQSTSATYSYNGTTFVFVSAVGNAANGLPIAANNALSIPAAAVPINSGANANYGVSVDLPPGTPLSTDTTAQGTPVTTTIQRGFPVPITAFLDVNNNGAIDPDPLVEPRNITIDRVYTGFLQLLKESRILQGTGAAVQGTDGTFSIGPKKPAPGNIIEYRITYKNISESISGTGNVILNADNVVITEDGTAGTNNWAIDNPPTNGVIDTSNVVGSAKDSGASTITFFNGIPAVLGSDITGLTAATDVTKYVNTVTGVVPPQTTRTFTFQRKLN